MSKGCCLVLYMHYFNLIIEVLSLMSKSSLLHTACDTPQGCLSTTWKARFNQCCAAKVWRKRSLAICSFNDLDNFILCLRK